MNHSQEKGENRKKSHKFVLPNGVGTYIHYIPYKMCEKYGLRPGKSLEGNISVLIGRFFGQKPG